MANDAKNRFPIRRKLRSVYIAIHTKIFPAIDKNIKSDKKMPANKEKKKKEIERKQKYKLYWQNERMDIYEGKNRNEQKMKHFIDL